MPKYYVNVEDPFDPKQYEVYAETKKDAERIAEKKNPHTPLRWTRVKTEAEKKNDDGLLAAAGAVIVAGLATYYTGKGVWYGIKGLWKGGNLAYQITRNPKIVSDYMEKRKLEAEKKKERHALWVKQKLEEAERRQNDPKVLEIKKWNEELNRKMLSFWVPLFVIILGIYGLILWFMQW
jgi:hypothetical protein